MALKLLYTQWTENGVTKSAYRASYGILDADVRSITDIVMYKQDCGYEYGSDEENPNAVTVSYINTTSGKDALIQIARYRSENENIQNCVVIDGYITEAGETLLPQLYIKNNCFKTSLTEEERLELIENADNLDITTLPKPQFRFNNTETKKFFTSVKRKTLKFLIQALIDSVDSERYVVFSDKPENIRYWFWAINCCLPNVTKRCITYKSYSHEIPRNIKLVCLYPCSGGFDYQAEAEKGNFVFDLINDFVCNDVDPGKYTVSIVDKFLTSINYAIDEVASVEKIMTDRSQNLSAAAGVYHLTLADVNWFDSLIEIKYSLGKLEAWASKDISAICVNLWNAINSPSSKHKITELMLPVIAYIFRNSDDATRESIMELFESKPQRFGVNPLLGTDEHLDNIKTKVPFLYDYIPDKLIEKGMMLDYIQSIKDNDSELYILANMVIDNAEKLDGKYNQNTVFLCCTDIMKQAVESDSIDLFISLYDKFSERSKKFAVDTFIHAYKDVKKSIPDLVVALGEIFMFTAMDRFVNDCAALVLLLSEYVREGYYSETVFMYYQRLYGDHPAETDAAATILYKNVKNRCFFSDFAIYRLNGDDTCDKDILTDYYNLVFLADRDKNGLFARKLNALMSTLHPSRQLEVSAEMLTGELFAPEVPRNREVRSLFASYITDQSFEILYEYFNINNSTVEMVAVALERTNAVVYTDSFKAVMLGIRLRNSRDDERTFVAISEAAVRRKLYGTILSDSALVSDFIQVFLPDIVRFLLKADETRETGMRSIIEAVLTDLCGYYHFVPSLNAILTDEELLSEKERTRLIGLLIVCASDNDEAERPLADCMSGILKGFLSSRRRDECITLLERVTDEAGKANAEATENYYYAYRKTHKTFGERIFGIKKRKKIASNGE